MVYPTEMKELEEKVYKLSAAGRYVRHAKENFVPFSIFSEFAKFRHVARKPPAPSAQAWKTR
jgi:hypothetical protein